MIITLPGLKAPECQCGEKTKVYLFQRGLKVRCPHCGKEASVSYATGFYQFSAIDLAGLVALIAGKTGE